MAGIALGGGGVPRPTAPLATKTPVGRAAAAPAPAAAGAPAADGAAVPKDTPLWVDMRGQDVPEKLAGMPMEDVLAVCTEGKHRKALYMQAEKVLGYYVADPENDVVFHDDASWADFASVGKALKQFGSKEECLCIAACPPLGCWAIGVGMKGQNRYKAAKAALAATLALQASVSIDLSEFGSFIEFVEEANTPAEGAAA